MHLADHGKSTVEAQTAEAAKILSRTESCDRRPVINLQMPTSRNHIYFPSYSSGCCILMSIVLKVAAGDECAPRGTVIQIVGIRVECIIMKSSQCRLILHTVSALGPRNHGVASYCSHTQSVDFYLFKLRIAQRENFPIQIKEDVNFFE